MNDLFLNMSNQLDAAFAERDSIRDELAKAQESSRKKAGALQAAVEENIQLQNQIGTLEVELARVKEENAEEAALGDKLADILTRTAIALRGPQPELTRWSWHDLPELVETLKTRNAELEEVLRKAGYEDTPQGWFHGSGEPEQEAARATKPEGKE